MVQDWMYCMHGICMVYAWYMYGMYGMACLVVGSAEVEEFEGLMTSEVCVKFLLDGYSL